MRLLKKDYVGETVGIFKIIEQMDYKTPDNHSLYLGKCTECGFVRIAKLSDLKETKKCVHASHSSGIYIHRTHWENQRIKRIFYGMRNRCYEENDKNYRWYGAKGIKICNEWLHNPKAFEDWALRNGYDDDQTIDRIDSEKDYCPENCRWVTNAQNTKYKSSTMIIKANGEVHTGRDWSKILGLGINIINKYIRKYGIDNTIDFIERYIKNPGLIPSTKSQSIYSLYMG